jgi:hypothetical protein
MYDRNSSIRVHDAERLNAGTRGGGGGRDDVDTYAVAGGGRQR